MDRLFLLFAESLTSIAVSLAVLYVLSGPLLLVQMVDMVSPFRDPIDSLRLALIAILGGLLIGLHLIGKRLKQFETTPQKSGHSS
jgi:hypothetical protein